MTYWAYMLHCRGGYFYVGHTDDLERRMAQYAVGATKGFVTEHWPAKLVWSQEFGSRYEALAAERRIKGWSRTKKLALVREDWADISRLAKGKDGPSTSSGRTGYGAGIDSSTVRAEPVEALLLLLHHSTSCSAVDRIYAALNRHNLTFTLTADIARIMIPNERVERTDELWRTTCFELFVKPEGAEAYREYNFAPSGAWAAYDFDGYRAGMRDADVPAPAISCTVSTDALVLTVEGLTLPKSGRIALSAIIEETDGTKSYWALAHPPGKPDFHHPTCFAQTLK